MEAALLAALWQAIRRSFTGQLTMDDVTGAGALAVDPDRAPNGKQNKLGPLLPYAARQGWLVNTGRSVKSTSPGRRGGRQSVWEITPAGYAEADRQAL